MVIDKAFWRGKSVFLTGHTGFKGGWLSLWLQRLGADVSGYACNPPTDPSLFGVAGVGVGMTSTIGDVRNADFLERSMVTAAPEIAFHFAAQPLVKASYDDPVGTYAVNVMGTVHFLEAVRRVPSVRAAIVVTSDKCYENREWIWPYRENEVLGGRDPYSSSKACAELLTAAWRESFLRGRVCVATVRAGNVIGGGDWARDRLVPDALRAWEHGDVLQVRYPAAVRPWQHVMEPLAGYLLTAQHLISDKADGAWNFGPDEADMVPVGELLNRLASRWGGGAIWQSDASSPKVHEAHVLRLDSSKARTRLTWRPKWTLNQALDRIVAWHRGYMHGEDMRLQCLSDIEEYEAS